MAWDEEVNERIWDAFESRDVDRFTALLRQFPDNLRTESGVRHAWIEDAAINGLVDFLRVLIDEFDMDVDEILWEDRREFTPLTTAARNAQVETVQWLIERGAQINFEVDGNVETPALQIAATQGHLDVVKLLVEHGGNVNDRALPSNPVTQADVYGHFEVRDYLISHGGKDLRELTPMDIPEGHRIVFKQLADEDGPSASRWHIVIPGDPPVRIYHRRASRKNRFETLFTIGLSDRNLPRGGYRFMHQELRLQLKKGWKLKPSALDDPRHNWPIEGMKKIVEGLMAEGRFPDEPVLFMNGDPPEPLGPKTDFCGWTTHRTFSLGPCELPDYRIVNFRDLYPIHLREADYVREHGSRKLLSRFDDAKAPRWLNPKRKPVV